MDSENEERRGVSNPDARKENGTTTGTSQNCKPDSLCQANTKEGYTFAQVPEVLRNLLQWGVWMPEWKNGKLQRVPYDAKTGKHLSSTNPATWSPFVVALEAYQKGTRGQWGGVSLVITVMNKVVGLDLDECVDEAGNLTTEAQAIVALFGSYCELSPSRLGVRGFAAGTLPVGRRKKGHLEIYDTKVLTITGWHLEGMPTTIEERTDAIAEIHSRFFGKKQTSPSVTSAQGALPFVAASTPLEDSEVIELALAAKNGARVQALMDGDLAGYASPSEADLAVCNYLAFYCGRDSHEQIDRIFRERFPFFRPDKWDTRHYGDGSTYGQHTIKIALEDRAEFYTRPLVWHPSAPKEPEERHEEEGSAAEEDASNAAAEMPTAAGGRPNIRITTKMTPVLNQAEKALLALPDALRLFQRLNQLCLVAYNAKPPPWVKLTRPVGAPSIAALVVEQLRERMSACANWFKLDMRSSSWKPALPPEWASKTLLRRGQWEFPVLTGIIAAPTVLSDGRVIETPGYDAYTGLFLDTQGIVFPPIPAAPTKDDAHQAVADLLVPFAEFPFAAPWGKVAAGASILSQVARHAFAPGCCPLFGVDANRAGAGKGLLIDASCATATGRPATCWAPTQDPEEDRKALLTIAMEGDTCVHIDNVNEPFGSAPLDSVLTAGVIQGRLLGLNKSARAPISTVFFASGNNISYVGDMARRVVPIRLETALEHPQERIDFEHPYLMAWVLENRPRLVVAALTIVKAYIVAGCPTQGVPGYGSFQEWSDLIRSSLIWAGCDDPCEGRKTIEAESDPIAANLARLLHCWSACYGAEPVTLSTVVGDITQHASPINANSNKWNQLRDTLAEFDNKYDGKALNTQKIGKALNSLRKRVCDNRWFVQVGAYQGAVMWAAQTKRPTSTTPAA